MIPRGLMAGVTLSSAVLLGCSCIPCAARGASTAAGLPSPRRPPLAWEVVHSRAELAARRAAAMQEGEAVAIEIWAAWCSYCRRYHDVIDRTPPLRSAFERLRRLRIDVTDDEALERHDDLRDALGIPHDVQPYILFIDARGVVRHDLDVPKWYAERAAPELTARLARLDAPE